MELSWNIVLCPRSLYVRSKGFLLFTIDVELSKNYKYFYHAIAISLQINSVSKILWHLETYFPIIQTF